MHNVKVITTSDATEYIRWFGRQFSARRTDDRIRPLGGHVDMPDLIEPGCLTVICHHAVGVSALAQLRDARSHLCGKRYGVVAARPSAGCGTPRTS
jgi:hypothetical protein